jgi:hypothetical protein
MNTYEPAAPIADKPDGSIRADLATSRPVDLEKMQEVREESYNRGYNNGRQDTALLSEAAIQARIDAAVLAERQSCAEAVTHMRVPPEMVSQSTLLQIALGVLRREENSDDAGDGEKQSNAGREQPQLTVGEMRQQIEAEHPDDPRHYGAAKVARLEAEWKASPPWFRWAALISDAICASSSVPLHYKHAVSDAMDALPLMPEEKAPKP